VHPLTAPDMNPRTWCRCSRAKSTRRGRAMATASAWALGAEGRGRRIRRGIRGLPPGLDPLASGGEEPAGEDMGPLAIRRWRGRGAGEFAGGSGAPGRNWIGSGGGARSRPGKPRPLLRSSVGGAGGLRRNRNLPKRFSVLLLTKCYDLMTAIVNARNTVN